MKGSSDIDIVLARLDRLIGDGPALCHFNGPLEEGAAEAFEEKYGIKLSRSYKAFLYFTNGGMIVDEGLHEIIKNDPEGLETAKWNANYLYSLEELEDAYLEMKNWNFGIPSENIATYPFIPFCHTSSGEHLIMVKLGKDENESPVLDAFHEETPETWGVVAESFADFLDDYINTYGRPEVLGDLARGSALDYIVPLEREEKESNEAIIDRCNREILDNPEDHWAYEERGMARKELGMLNEALDDFNRAISLKPEDAYYYFTRGDLYQKAGKNRAALIDYDIAVKFSPDDTLYLNSRAEILFQMGKYEKALEDVNQAIAIDDRDILAYMIRASIWHATGEEEKAMEDSRRVDELQHDDPD